MTAAALVVVALGGALGAVARFLLDIGLRGRFGDRWPYGTFAANVIGSLVLGAMAGVTFALAPPAWVAQLVGVGFCGALTTFSGFVLQVVDLSRTASPAVSVRGFAYAAVSVGVGLLAAALVPALVG